MVDGGGTEPMASVSGDGRLRARLEQLFGDVDPEISLHGPGSDEASRKAIDVLRRLASRQVVGDRYLVHECVGRGGMGKVLRVWDEDLRRNLAMKVLQGEIGDGTVPADVQGDEMGSGSVDRLLEDLRRHVGADASDGTPTPAVPRADFSKVRQFLEEAQITGQLDHPGIVPVHEVGLDDDGHVFFTMKLVKGETLRAVFERVHSGSKDWTRTRVLGLLLRVCEAMSYAHAKGVIHRDLKPSNIMVGAFGEVYVMDWGLACVVDRNTDGYETVSIDTAFDGDALETSKTARTTGGHRVVGTPVYMPPEQASGAGELISPAHDVYAIGAMIYHLLARRPPYTRETGGKVRAVLAELTKGPPDPLHRVAADAPEELVAICDKAMARDVGERYSDTSELADDLRAFLEQRVVSAYETGAVAELRKWVVRNRGLAGTLAALIVVAFAGVAMFAQLSNELGVQNEALTLALDREQDMGEVLESRNADLAISLDDAREARREAELERSRVLRLLVSPMRDRLVAEADELWPLSPDDIPLYEDWLERADALVATLDSSPDHKVLGHRERLAALRERALPISAEALQLDWQRHPEYAEWVDKRDGVAELEGVLSELRRKTEAGKITPAEARIRDRIETNLPAVIVERDDLAAQVCQQRMFTFEDGDDALWHGEIVRIIAEIESFSDAEQGLIDGISRAHGWGVARRLEETRRLEELTLTSRDARRRWNAAVASIATLDIYGGLDITPQFGLLPIGRDRESGLWEFWHAMSGAEPQRAEDGGLVLDLDTGIVLVLIPGGTAWLGAQSYDPEGHNYDPMAEKTEGPVYEETLEPYFMSKYELSQGQWVRMTGHNPAHYPPGANKAGERARTLLRPVENVTWDESVKLLTWYGLVLPSESEWEYAARGGTTTPWWAGSTRDDLTDVVNFFDMAGDRGGADFDAPLMWPGFDDGAIIHETIDYGRENPFGLSCVHGNVLEWCRTLYRPTPGPNGFGEMYKLEYVIRGGSFLTSPGGTRSASRGNHASHVLERALGLRPARPIMGR